jgi:hypothetical protein
LKGSEESHSKLKLEYAGWVDWIGTEWEERERAVRWGRIRIGSDDEVNRLARGTCFVRPKVTG